MMSYPGGHGNYGPPAGGGGAGYQEKNAKAIYEQRKKLGRGTFHGEMTQYHVEHLVTLQLDPEDNLSTMKDALQRLIFLNSTGKIWTQEMFIQVEPNCITLLDLHSKEPLEKFEMSMIQQCKVEGGDSNAGRLLTLVVKEGQYPPDVYFFQTPEANIIQSDIESGVADGRNSIKKIRPETLRVNKENLERMGLREDSTDNDSSQMSQGRSRGSNSRPPIPFMDQGMQPSPPPQDKYGDSRLLNSLLDEIEVFVRRLQKIQEALSEIGKMKKKKTKGKKKSSGVGVLTLRAQPPAKEEFVDHFQKFKLLLNLLTDMKGVLKNPQAEEMLHQLMRPLSMMVIMCGGPELARTVLSPPLTKSTVDFMKLNLTAQEKAQWNALGDAWTRPESEWHKSWKPIPYTPQLKEPIGSRFGAPTQPAMPAAQPLAASHPPPAQPPQQPPPPPQAAQPPPAEPAESLTGLPHVAPNKSASLERGERLSPSAASPPPTLPRTPLVRFVKAKYDYVARTSAELSINSEDILEVLDDSENWWRVKNENGSVGFVPSNMVEPLKKSTGKDRKFFDDNVPYREPERKKDRFDHRTTQMDLLTSELEKRLMMAAKPPASHATHQPRESSMEISIHSQPADVQLWLSTQGYHHRTQAHLTGVNGDQLFAMSRDYMMSVCPEEGAQLYSRLDQYRPHSWDQNFNDDLGRKMLMMQKYH